MNTKILEEVGLTKTEIKIYLALLRLGQTTTTNIIREANINASKVYEFLDKLIQKGLASYVIQSNKKYFTATDPKNLKEFLREKEEKIQEQQIQIDNLIPSLNSIKAESKGAIKSETYEGLKGLKSIYEKILSILKKGQTQYVIGAPRIGNELLEGYILNWHKKRIKNGIECKYIYDANARDYGKVRKEMKYTKVKYMPNNISSPIWVEIFGDYVMVGHLKGYNAIMFLIQDKEIAKGYLDYFNLIWKASKP